MDIFISYYTSTVQTGATRFNPTYKKKRSPVAQRMDLDADSLSPNLNSVPTN